MPRRKKTIQTPEGFHDILPQDQPWWDFVNETVKSFADFYGFGRIETPILEFSELFTKGIGLSNDIVEKQMFGFKTKGGDEVTLRPEGTAPVARSYIFHGMDHLPQPVKLYYTGPMFRHERPQRGRQREFWQFGFEVMGDQSPVMDAEIILIFFRILECLGFKNLKIQINSIGCSQCRPYYKKILKNFYRSRIKQICPDCKRRIKFNPLRVLDCKEEKCQRVKIQVPHIVDHLCQDCHNHFKSVLEFLDELQIPVNLNPYLVRGLDYYTKTVFEIWPDTAADPKQKYEFTSQEKEFQASQGALGGGGRYDDLIKSLGGKSIPAVGFAAGIERIIQDLKIRGKQYREISQPQVFLAQLGELARRKSLALLEEFRNSKIKIAESLGRDSIKSQLNIADKLGMKYSLILGQREALDKTIIMRDMQTGVQEIIKIDKIIEEVRKRLKR